MPSNPPPARPNQPKKKKDVPEWESREHSSIDRRVKLVWIVLAVLAVPMIVAIVVMVRQRSTDRNDVVERWPALVNAGPPELPEPFICDLNAGFRVGPLKVSFRNTGSAAAVSAIPRLTLHLMPERKVGMPVFDDIPAGDCRDRAVGTSGMSPIEPGRTESTQLQPPSVAMPPLTPGELVQMYGVSCVYYSDSHGVEHGSCDTYRFRQDDGKEAFLCDATPKTGKFQPGTISNCAF